MTPLGFHWETQTGAALLDAGWEHITGQNIATSHGQSRIRNSLVEDINNVFFSKSDSCKSSPMNFCWEEGWEHSC